jgi:6-pyruvoyltetrahydropterin/6-carboxytetrahydropterin synthase
MMEIKKILKTETAHIVRDAVSTRCKYNIHGHSYKWIVHIQSQELKENGMVLDFKELEFIKQYIDMFDHSCVFYEGENKAILQFFRANFKRIIVMKHNPTAENMARLIHNYTNNCLRGTPYTCPQVEVWETETGCGIAYDSDNDDIITKEYTRLEE